MEYEISENDSLGVSDIRIHDRVSTAQLNRRLHISRARCRSHHLIVRTEHSLAREHSIENADGIPF
jgi:hypothetical protein